MKVQPYLFFEGRCEEALEFYKTALGAEVIMSMHSRDNPEPPEASRIKKQDHARSSSYRRH